VSLHPGRLEISTVHERSFGCAAYSAELAGVVVREVRAEFEGGAVSSWKCTAVRDGAALLDVFHRTGTLDLPPLSPWNELRLPPTPEQLAEDDNLHALVWVAQQLLRDKGLSAKTLHNYHRDGFHPDRSCASGAGTDRALASGHG
jgi:hypothetical protein